MKRLRVAAKRCYGDELRPPLLEIEDAQIQALLWPVLGEAVINEIKLVKGGLVNTLYRVRLADENLLCLRIFAAGRRAWEHEERELPVVFAECRELIEVIVADG